MTQTSPAADPAPAEAEPAPAVETAASDGEAIKSRFTRAIEDARASADALRNEAAELTSAARERATAAASEWTEQAGTYANQARERGIDLANQGKARTSEAIAAVGRAISDTAPVIDEKLGVTYGDYARQAATAIDSTAERLANRDFAELGEDVKAFVRKSPATALGIAAVTGFLFARLFSRSGDREA